MPDAGYSKKTTTRPAISFTCPTAPTVIRFCKYLLDNRPQCGAGMADK
jgi:hypothetical protein